MAVTFQLTGAWPASTTVNLQVASQWKRISAPVHHTSKDPAELILLQKVR